jgi:hypothetical protein
MPDCRPGHGTPIDIEKMRSLLVGRRSERPVVQEGRQHPETGRPWKTTTTEVGSTTEHATRDDRVDAVAFVPTIRAVRDPATGKVKNVG